MSGALTEGAFTQSGGQPNLNPLVLRTAATLNIGAPHRCATWSQSASRSKRHSETIRWLGDDDPNTRRVLETILYTEEAYATDMLDLLDRMETD